MSENLEQARESLKYGKFIDAADFARKAIAEQPIDADAHSFLGVALSRLNQQQEAETELREAIRLAPEVSKHHYNLAAHLFAVGNRDAARLAALATLDREPSHQAANDLLARIAGESAPFQQETQYGVQSPDPFAKYTPGPPRRQVHSIGFVQALGWAWDVLGWFLFAALGVSRMVLDQRLLKYIQGPGDQFEQSMQAAERAFRENSSLFIAVFVWFGVMAMWWIFDMADRRPPGGLVTLGIVGILGFLCCPIFALVLFPLYYFLRVQASKSQIG